VTILLPFGDVLVSDYFSMPCDPSSGNFLVFLKNLYLGESVDEAANRAGRPPAAPLASNAAAEVAAIEAEDVQVSAAAVRSFLRACCVSTKGRGPLLVGEPADRACYMAVRMRKVVEALDYLIERVDDLEADFADDVATVGQGTVTRLREVPPHTLASQV